MAVKKARKQKMVPRTKKNFRPTKKGAGMTEAGVKAYRRKNPGSKLKRKILLNQRRLEESHFVLEVKVK